MENLNIQKTNSSPEVAFDIENGIFNLSGKSYPENSFDFYEPVLESLRDFFKNSSSETLKVVFDITYLNSSSTRVFFEIFDILVENNDSKKIIIEWHYDASDEATLEVGEEFKEEFEELIIKLIEK